MSSEEEVGVEGVVSGEILFVVAACHSVDSCRFVSCLILVQAEVESCLTSECQPVGDVVCETERTVSLVTVESCVVVIETPEGVSVDILEWICKSFF